MTIDELKAIARMKHELEAKPSATVVSINDREQNRAAVFTDGRTFVITFT